MRFENILKHPYYVKIQALLYEDEIPSKVCNWVRNTVDADDTIAIDRKSDFYLREAEVKEFKESLKQEVAQITVTAQENALVPTDGKTAEVVTDPNNKVPKSLVVEDIERQIVNLNSTFLNTFRMVEERMTALIKQMATEGKINPFLEGLVQKYLAEIRNLSKDYARISGLENFYQKVGSKAGDVQAKTKLSDRTKMELRKLLKDVLGEVNPSRIPGVLNRLEEILDETE